MFYSRREVIIMMNTITLLTAASKLFRGWHRDALPKKENRSGACKTCNSGVSVIVDNTLADVLANS